MEFNDLKAQYKKLEEEINGNIQQVLRNTDFIMGKFVEEFEESLAEYIGVGYAVSCGSGTDALQLIYMAYGIGSGDVVFCPDMTFIASIEPACMLGAVPVFCDIDKDTYNISAESLERQIRAVLRQGKLRPRAIVAVDLFGNPADYDTLSAIAEKYDLLLIEDAAQGTGASYKGKKCGSFGNIAATSFFPSKPLGCYGDGGAVFTNDAHMQQLINSLRIHGKGSDKYDNIRIGMNSRLDTVQASIMLPKLKILEEEVNIRQQTARRYDLALKDTYIIPKIQEKAISVYAQYTLLADNKQRRDELRSVLQEKGIPTNIYYRKPMHKMKVFEDCFRGEEDFGNSTDCTERIFSIPFSAYLTKEDQEKIIDALLHC